MSDTFQSYQTQHRYSSRTAANRVQLKYPTTNKESYRKPFFISSIQFWNNLSSSITNFPSLSCFKIMLKKNSNTTQHLFNHNIPRHAQIVIAQLRIGFSDLNSHLFEKDALKVLGALVDTGLRTFVILFGIAQYTRDWGSHC